MIGIGTFFLGAIWHALGIGLDWVMVVGGVVVVLASYGLALAYPPLAVVMRFLGPVARLLGFGLILVGSVNLYAAEKVSEALAAYQEKERAAVAAAVLEQQRKGDQALTAAVSAAEDRARASMPIRQVIVNAARPSACSTPDNLRAVGVELLRRSGGDKSGLPNPSGGAHSPVSKTLFIAGPRKL